MAEQTQIKQPQLPGMETEEKPEGKKVKVHPLYGEYKDVTVVPLQELDMKSTGFVSIGAYTAEYQYNTKHSFPEKVIQFIENLTQPKRVVKETYDPETGPKSEIVKTNIKRFNVIRH